MPDSKGLSPHELAHMWAKDLESRPPYEHKSGMIIPRYANTGRIVRARSAEQSVGIITNISLQGVHYHDFQ